MREMSVAEQRYQAVLAVIKDGRTVRDVAGQWSVSRQTVHAWLAKYEAGGLEGLADRSRRPASCPHQMPADVEALVLELRRAHPYWGAQRIGVTPPSRTPVLRRLGRWGHSRPFSGPLAERFLHRPIAGLLSRLRRNAQLIRIFATNSGP
jgi:hypothetical protein